MFVVAREKLRKEPRPCLEGVVIPVRSNSFFWKTTDKNIKGIGSQQWFPQHQKKTVKIHSETLRFCLCLKLVVNLMNITLVSTKCRLQTAADHCLHHANENVTTIIPLFCNTENNGLQSVCSQSAVCILYCPNTENSENKPRGLYFSKALFEGLIFGGACIRLD